VGAEGAIPCDKKYARARDGGGDEKNKSPTNFKVRHGNLKTIGENGSGFRQPHQLYLFGSPGAGGIWRRSDE
jgi:hypothetical protein